MSSDSSRSHTVRFDSRVFRVSAIKKALYRFAGICSAEIVLSENNNVDVVVLSNSDSVDLEKLVADIRNEVLDQDLREVIAEETAAIRNLLLAQAFSRTSLVDSAGENEDYRLDSQGIRSNH